MKSKFAVQLFILTKMMIMIICNQNNTSTDVPPGDYTSSGSDYHAENPAVHPEDPMRINYVI